MPRHALRAFLVLVPCLLVLSVPAAAEDPAPGKPAGEPPFTLSVAFGSEMPQPHRVGYGGVVPVRVTFHNRSTAMQQLFWDQRSDGVLRITFEDEDGLVWKPHVVGSTTVRMSAKPVLVTGTPWTALSQPTPVKVMPGSAYVATMAFSAFTLASPPPRGYEGRLVRELPPGRYIVRARYVKRDALVPVGPPTWNPRLIQIHPTQKVRVWPGLFTGTLDARARLEVTAPRRADVDELKQRIRDLEARNRALTKQLDAIREILREG